MSTSLEILAEEWAKRGAQFPKTTALLKQALKTAKEEKAPKVFTSEDGSKQPSFRKVFSEIPLEENLTAQRQITIERMVRPLGLDEGNALKELTFPFPERKPSYDRHHLSVPLLVPQFRGVSWLDACDALGFYISGYLRDMIKANKIHNWEDPREVSIPEDPHGLWLQDGTQWVNRKPVDVRAELQKDENKDLLTRGLWGGFALALLRLDMVKGKGWDLIGDRVGSDDVLCLDAWHGRPKFNAYSDDDARPSFRAFVCGS